MQKTYILLNLCIRKGYRLIMMCNGSVVWYTVVKTDKIRFWHLLFYTADINTQLSSFTHNSKLFTYFMMWSSTAWNMSQFRELQETQVRDMRNNRWKQYLQRWKHILIQRLSLNSSILQQSRQQRSYIWKFSRVENIQMIKEINNM